MFRSLVDRFTTASPLPSAAAATKPRSDGFSTATSPDALFPRTDPSVDGDDCLHDCASCTISYPRKFAIDETDALYGAIQGWSRHVLVATGKTDWVRRVEDEQDSVMQAIGAHIDAVQGGKLMLSASNLSLPHDPHAAPYGLDRPTSLLLLPAFVFVDGVTPKHVPALIDQVVNSAPTTTTPLLHATALPAPSVPTGLSLRPCTHRALVLVCSQATRDARCGQSAPLLRREFERHLRPLGLHRDADDERPGGVPVVFISHVGGHKYSANVLVYRKAERAGEKGDEQAAQAAQCIWLARVRPQEVENIVRYTVLQGKVVKPDEQLRGGFDRSRGVVSW